MASQQYYNNAPPAGYPPHPQPMYGGQSQGYYQQPQQYAPAPQPQYYQQGPPPRQRSEKGCFEACIATLCCCFVCEEGCECCADCCGCLEGCC